MKYSPKCAAINRLHSRSCWVSKNSININCSCSSSSMLNKINWLMQL